MLSSSLQQILDNRLRYLPDITAKAIASVDWSTKLIEIGHGYGLHIDEVEDLQSVVMRSMVGMIQPADFEQSLISALALSPANAEKMISEINAQVFQPIHDFVMAGGKTPDGMVGMGIHVEESEPHPAGSAVHPLLEGEGAEHTPTVEITNELELPEITPNPFPTLPQGEGVRTVSENANVAAPSLGEGWDGIKITPPDTFENLFFPQDTGHDAELEDIFADDEDSKVQ